MADAPILTNPLKEMMKAGKVALGMNVRLARSGDIARIAKSCGHDFIFIDGQHAIFTRETIAHIAHTALGCGITPIARVRSVDDQDVQVLLDNGVMGIVYPDVNTAAEARRAVARAKFPRWASAPPRAATRCSTTARCPCQPDGAGAERRHAGGVHDRDAGRREQRRRDRQGGRRGRDPHRRQRSPDRDGQARVSSAIRKAPRRSIASSP